MVATACKGWQAQSWGQLQGGWRRAACSVRKRIPQLAPCRDGHPGSYYTAAASRTLGLRTWYRTVLYGNLTY